MKEITGKLQWVLRLEGLAILLLSSIAFEYHVTDWKLFALLFLVPDFALIGYVLNSKTGAVLYNMTHSLIGPALFLCLGVTQSESLFISLGLIWSAHIGFDRFLGYGLKYSTGFHYTHLGKVGEMTT